MCYARPEVLHELLLICFLVIPLFFTRALLEIESPTTRRPHAYFDISIDFTGLFFVFDCAA